MNKVSCLIIVLLFMVAGTRTANAQFTETREFTKRFAVKPETRIEISNKYGKIELVTWTKDSVVVDVKMRVEKKKATQLDKTLDNIDFDFTNSTHYLIIRTIADKNRSQLESEFLKFKETLLQADGAVEVDYKIWLPANNPLKVENKFGDIFLENYNGPAEINLSNGKLKADSFSKRTTINLNFADASVNNLSNGRITSNYSDIYIKEAGNLNISGKSSTIEIIESDELVISSRRDKIRVRLADKVEAEGSFSSIRLSQLTDRGTFRINYGDLEIEKTASDFSNIYIESRNTDVSLYFSTESHFNFELTETKANLNLGREITVADKKLVNEKDGTNRMEGHFGKKTKEEQKLYINAISGSVRVSGN